MHRGGRGGSGRGAPTRPGDAIPGATRPAGHRIARVRRGGVRSKARSLGITPLRGGVCRCPRAVSRANRTASSKSRRDGGPRRRRGVRPPAASDPVWTSDSRPPPGRRASPWRRALLGRRRTGRGRYGARRPTARARPTTKPAPVEPRRFGCPATRPRRASPRDGAPGRFGGLRGLSSPVKPVHDGKHPLRSCQGASRDGSGAAVARDGPRGPKPRPDPDRRPGTAVSPAALPLGQVALHHRFRLAVLAYPALVHPDHPRAPSQHHAGQVRR